MIEEKDQGDATYYRVKFDATLEKIWCRWNEQSLLRLSRKLLRLLYSRGVDTGFRICCDLQQKDLLAS